MSKKSNEIIEEKEILSKECGCDHNHGNESHDECNHNHGGESHDECGCFYSHLQNQEGKNQNNDLTIKEEQSVFILENLGCAHCAAKMEEKILELPDVKQATITFATKQLRLRAKDSKILLSEIQKICSSIESEVKVVPREEKNIHSKGEHIHESKKELIGLIGGAALFVLGKLLENMKPEWSIWIFVVAYIILGGKILVTAVKNILKGQVFDENFLMGIATLGAFAIKEYPEAVGVMLFFRIGEFFEHKAVERSRGQIMSAVDLRPEVVNLVDNGQVRIIDANEAKVGQILVVRPGDRIPLDGVVVDGESRIDTSPVTGEPVPVKVQEGSQVISGCVNTSGLLKVRVEKVLEESMVTRILNSVENAAANKPKIDRFITKFARVYTPFVVAIAASTVIIPSLITGNWGHWVYTGLTFLVISCPCALVLSVPLTFFSGIGAGSKRGILFKGGVSLEALNEVTTVVMDKTGTITEGNFIVQEVVPVESVEATQVLAMAASCEFSSTHPIGDSILSAAKQQSLTIEQPSSVKEIAGKGIQAQTSKGRLLCGNKRLMEQFAIDLSEYREKGFGTEVLIALENQYMGQIKIADTIKGNAASVISSLKKLSISTAMLTGDGKESAEAVAKQTGIDQIYARLLPEEKLNKLIEIRENNGKVMFVGDGINDAPVLAGADVGAAMGSGADAAIEAADVVFMTSNMNAIPQSIEIASQTNKIAKQNIIFALVIKALVMGLGLAGYASMWMAVFADSGVALLCVLNSIRILYKK